MPTRKNARSKSCRRKRCRGKSGRRKTYKGGGGYKIDKWIDTLRLDLNDSEIRIIEQLSWDMMKDVNASQLIQMGMTDKNAKIICNEYNKQKNSILYNVTHNRKFDPASVAFRTQIPASTPQNWIKTIPLLSTFSDKFKDMSWNDMKKLTKNDIIGMNIPPKAAIPIHKRIEQLDPLRIRPT